MSITPIRELERLEVAYLTAKVAYEYAIQRSAVAWDERDKYHEARDALMRAVTLDTIRALLDVAQAARESFVSTDPDAIPALFRAIAPLVKEATDE